MPACDKSIIVINIIIIVFIIIIFVIVINFSPYLFA